MSKKQKPEYLNLVEDPNNFLNVKRWKAYPLQERIAKATEIVNNILAQRHRSGDLHTESDPFWKDRLFSHLVHGILTPESVGYELFGGGIRRMQA